MKIKMVEQVIEVEDDVGRSLLNGQVPSDKIVQLVPVRRGIRGREKVLSIEINVPLRYEEVVDDVE